MPNKSAKQYFDFHFHPVFKKFITKYETDELTQRTDLTDEIRFSNSIVNSIADIALQLLLSQSSINQCEKGQVRLGVASIANLELGFAASKGFLAQILKSKLTAPLDKKYFTIVADGQISYYRLFLKELDIYRQLSTEDIGKVEMLTRNKSKVRKQVKGKPVPQLKLAMSLEGGHNLSCMMVGRTNIEDQKAINEFQRKLFAPAYTNPKDEEKYDALVGINPAKNLDRLHELMWKSGMDIMYLTLSHLTFIAEQSLATHAYGMKMLKHPLFYPVGTGITQMGKEVIRQCYDMQRDKEPTPILIDVKHMSWEARRQFYELMEAEDESIFTKKRKRRPFIASHVGVTGYSINEWKGALKRDKCRLATHEMNRCVEIEMERKKCGEWGSALNNEFTFNPWSINLMDEDIMAVLQSGGIIGLTLDTRILGFQNKRQQIDGDSAEYLSTTDFQLNFPYIGLKSLPTKAVESMAVQNESWLVPTKDERHPLCFCFNIVHIIAVATLRDSTIAEPWKQICIGTDYDGFVDPLKISPNASSFDDLRFNILKWLPVAAEAYMKENGGGEKLANLFKQNLDTMVDYIMHKTGEEFMQHWLSGHWNE